MNPTKWWHPDTCPVTNRPFFMWVEHHELGWVPTYGGPYDSYTIPKWNGGEFVCERFDHDEGGWMDSVGLYLKVVDTSNLIELEDDSKKLAAAQAEVKRLREAIESALQKMLKAELWSYGLLCVRDTLQAALSTPADTSEIDRLVADAGRYRMLRRGQRWSVINGIGDTLRGDQLDAAIDAARAEVKS